jgi:hypothetical protein
VLTGHGADIIVIDDPLNSEEALSQAQRQATNENGTTVRPYPLQPPERQLTGAIVLSMHRVRESLPSSLTRRPTSPATCWRTSREWSAFLSNLYQTPFKKRNNRMCL